MTRRAVKRIVSRIESLKDQLSVCWIGPELFPDPLELVEGGGTEVLPLHILFRADLRPSSPAPAIGPGKAAFGIGKKIPEVFGRAKITYFVVSIYIPHKLTKEIGNGHFTKSKSGKAVS